MLRHGDQHQGLSPCRLSTLKAGLGALGLKELHLLSRAFAEIGLRKAKEKGEEVASGS